MDAVVLFGSQVSGGSDDRSDQDLLVICKPSEKQKKIKEYSNQGYSVSVYTPKQLNLMKEHGSLFLQHLKLESQVLHDADNLFSKFISSCQFMPPQNSEIKSCITTIINTMKCPSETEFSWWASDYLFVLSRDFLVKYFSLSGNLIFNTKQLYREIQSEFNLNQFEAETFLELRELKSIYRNKGVQHNSVQKVVDDWCLVLCKILECEFPVRQCLNAYLNHREVNDFESTYELLRYIESLKLAFPSVKCSVESEVRIKKLVTTPNHYSSTSINGKAYLASYLTEFRQSANKFLNNNAHRHGHDSLYRDFSKTFQALRLV